MPDKASNICQQNISVLDLRLTPLLVHRDSVAALDEVALAEHTAYDIQPAWGNETLIGKDNFDLRL